MPREFSRQERVADHLRRELSLLIQRELSDPRLSLVSITDVRVSRDIAHARVFFTCMNCDSEEDARPVTTALSGAAGYLRNQLASSTSMRKVPSLRFQFDTSVGRGRDMEALISKAKAADQRLRPSASASPELAGSGQISQIDSVEGTSGEADSAFGTGSSDSKGL
ncbi:MAG: 30S ribosome-binding factor RbfA [Pseudomonadota bacterium]